MQRLAEAPPLVRYGLLAALVAVPLGCVCCLVIASGDSGTGASPRRTDTPPTYTQLPTYTAIPSYTPFPSLTATVTEVPTVTPIATAAPDVPDPPQSPVCTCSADVYNCGDFSSTSAAQACFDYCKSQGAGDVHDMDRDGDGLACE